MPNESCASAPLMHRRILVPRCYKYLGMFPAVTTAVQKVMAAHNYHDLGSDPETRGTVSDQLQ